MLGSLPQIRPIWYVPDARRQDLNRAAFGGGRTGRLLECAELVSRLATPRLPRGTPTGHWPWGPSSLYFKSGLIKRAGLELVSPTERIRYAFYNSWLTGWPVGIVRDAGHRVSGLAGLRGNWLVW